MLSKNCLNAYHFACLHRDRHRLIIAACPVGLSDRRLVGLSENPQVPRYRSAVISRRASGESLSFRTARLSRVVGTYDIAFAESEVSKSTRNTYSEES